MQNQIIQKLKLYQNENLIKLFLLRDGACFSFTEAQDIFEELKKLLFLLYQIENKNAPIQYFQLTSDLDAIDKLWHQFILMTPEYIDFCKIVFNGTYIHHRPDLQTFDQSNHVMDQIKKQIYYVEEIWGSQTVIKWYHDIPKMTFKNDRIWRKMWRKIIN